MNLERRLKTFRVAKYSNRLLMRSEGIARQKFWRDVILTLGSDSIITLFGIISGVLAARLLGPAGRGEMAAAMVWATVLGTVATLGVPHALTFFTARDPEDAGNIFSTAVIIWLFQSIVVLIAGWLAISIVLGTFQPTVVDSVQIYLFSVPCSMLISYIATISQGRKNFRLFNGVRFAAAASYLGGLIVAGLLHWQNVHDVMVLLLASQAVAATLALIMFWIQLPSKGAFHWQLMVSILKYGSKAYIGNLSWLANSRLDQFVMSAFISPSELGYYAVAVSYATVPLFIAGGLAYVLFPSVAESSATNAAISIKRVLKVNFALSSAIALFMILVSPIIIPFVFGTSYQLSVYPAIILLVGTVLLSSDYILGTSLRGLGHPLIPSIAELSALGVTIIGLILFLPRFGILGAACVSVASYAVAVVILYIMSRIVLRSASNLQKSSERQTMAKTS